MESGSHSWKSAISSRAASALEHTVWNPRVTRLTERVVEGVSRAYEFAHPAIVGIYSPYYALAARDEINRLVKEELLRGRRLANAVKLGAGLGANAALGLYAHSQGLLPEHLFVIAASNAIIPLVEGYAKRNGIVD